MSEVKLYQGDCIEILPTIPDGSVDCIITDLPYSVLSKSSEGGKWDNAIPLDPLWNQFLRVAKHNAAIVLFAQGMFSAAPWYALGAGLVLILLVFGVGLIGEGLQHGGKEVA